ncbi:MAG TPA: CHAP domain-containing protein [Acidimicrobiales bacterium]|nr:CHAP domain-containing protein [Acidimicrobiales bacterium]
MISAALQRVSTGPIDDTPPAELDPMAVAYEVMPIPLEMEQRPWTPAALVATDARVDRALAFLEAQVGLAEYPAGSNANWLTEWYGMGHVAWCAITVSRALIEGGFGIADRIDIEPVRTTTRLGWAYCPYVEDDFRNAGRWHESDPQPGDLVLYDWDGDEWADHIGMLAEVRDDGALLVFEGNTDEGVLRLKVRSLTYVRGFARPPWTVTAPAPAPIPEPAQEDSMYFVDGPDEVGGGVYVSDGDRCWGAHSQAYVERWFFGGHFPHAGKFTPPEFWEMRDRDGSRRNPGVGLAAVEAEGVITVNGVACRSMAEVTAARSAPRA